MPWSKAGPGHYQRPLGENEKFIKAIGDRAHAGAREHWSITCKGSFKLTEPLKVIDLSTDLRCAWKALRYEHPSIASTAEEETLNYIIPDFNALDSWARETFFVYDEKISADDLIASFKPSPFLTAHFLSDTFQLILHTAHWRTDGYGALQILNAFFDIFLALEDRDPAKLPWGQEIDRLVPSIEEALNLSKDAKPEVDTAVDQYISTLAHMKGAVGLSYRGDSNTIPSATRSARLRLSRPTSEAISKACRARDISVLSAVHASVAAITYAGAPVDSKGKHYTCTIRFTLRPYLTEPYNAPTFASALYTGGYMFKVSASQSWAENAKQYSEEYHRGVTREFLQARRQYALKVQDLMRRSESVAASPPPSEVDVSSVGDAELLVSTTHRRGESVLEVLDVSIGVETLTRQMYCFVWTFRGQIEFNLVFNEAYYHPSFPADLLAKLRENLEKELQL